MWAEAKKCPVTVGVFLYVSFPSSSLVLDGKQTFWEILSNGHLLLAQKQAAAWICVLLVPATMGGKAQCRKQQSSDSRHTRIGQIQIVRPTWASSRALSCKNRAVSDKWREGRKQAQIIRALEHKWIPWYFFQVIIVIITIIIKHSYARHSGWELKQSTLALSSSSS